MSVNRSSLTSYLTSQNCASNVPFLSPIHYEKEWLLSLHETMHPKRRAELQCCNIDINANKDSSQIQSTTITFMPFLHSNPYAQPILFNDSISKKGDSNMHGIVVDTAHFRSGPTASLLLDSTIPNNTEQLALY